MRRLKTGPVGLSGSILLLVAETRCAGARRSMRAVSSLHPALSICTNTARMRKTIASRQWTGSQLPSSVKEPAGSIQALEEVISAAAITGAPLHVVHIHSTGGPATPKLLQMIAEAKSHKLDVTTECYPYIAGMTDIKSAIFDEGWQEVFGIDYKDLQLAATGSDADLTIFDPQTISDRATFQDPAQYSEGIKFVIVNGVLVVKDGQLQSGFHPGLPVRAPLQN